MAATRADEGVNAAEGASACLVAPSTLVATPSSERAIGCLAVGDTVLVYSPATGRSEPEPVQHVWRNHDHDLVDVQLTTTATASGAASSGNPDATARQTTTTASSSTTRLHRWVRQGMLAAGLAATLLTATAGGWRDGAGGHCNRDWPERGNRHLDD